MPKLAAVSHIHYDMSVFNFNTIRLPQVAFPAEIPIRGIAFPIITRNSHAASMLCSEIKIGIFHALKIPETRIKLSVEFQASA